MLNLQLVTILRNSLLNDILIQVREVIIRLKKKPITFVVNKSTVWYFFLK